MKKSVMRSEHMPIRVLDMAEAVNHYRDFAGLIETNRDAGGQHIRFDSRTGHYAEIKRTGSWGISITNPEDWPRD